MKNVYNEMHEEHLEKNIHHMKEYEHFWEDDIDLPKHKARLLRF